MFWESSLVFSSFFYWIFNNGYISNFESMWIAVFHHSVFNFYLTSLGIVIIGVFFWSFLLSSYLCFYLFSFFLFWSIMSETLHILVILSCLFIFKSEKGWLVVLCLQGAWPGFTVAFHFRLIGCRVAILLENCQILVSWMTFLWSEWWGWVGGAGSKLHFSCLMTF